MKRAGGDKRKVLAEPAPVDTVEETTDHLVRLANEQRDGAQRLKELLERLVKGGQL